MKLIPERLRGETASFDIKLGKKMIAERGKRITARHVNEMKKSSTDSLIVPIEYLDSKILSHDIIDEETGEIKVKELHVNIPEHRKSETEDLVNILGEEVVDEFPWKDNTKPSTENLIEGVLRRTWRPALSVVGANGLPPSENAGNVLRPYTELQLSLRIPPMVDPILA